MVEIFKTNVDDPSHALQIITLLSHHFPAFAINFDLHDCDKILRIKGDSIPVDKIVDIVSQSGFDCSVLN
jgi:tRNA G26 N,N-dimethylase Trm1